MVKTCEGLGCEQCNDGKELGVIRFFRMFPDGATDTQDLAFRQTVAHFIELGINAVHKQIGRPEIYAKVNSKHRL